MSPICVLMTDGNLSLEILAFYLKNWEVMNIDDMCEEETTDELRVSSKCGTSD